MDARKGTNILEGEASESDEEVSDYPGFIQNLAKDNTAPAEKPPEGPSSSVMVTGEASESENEEEDFLLRRTFPSLNDKDIQEFEIQVANDQKRPKFESPFHKKLWESNFAFRLGVVEAQLDRYSHLVNRLQTFVPHANNSQNYAQEALKCYRSLSDATKQLNDNLETVLQTAELPKINMPVPVE